jgi:hypothetical protein
LDSTPSFITVKVSTVEGVPIQLRPALGNPAPERRCVTGLGAAEEDVCTLADILPGEYTLAPEGLGLSLPVTIAENERLLVIFDLEVLPPGVTGWQVSLTENTNGIRAVPQTEGIITVQVEGRPGQIVALRSIRGTEDLCEVTFNPFVNGLLCEFSGLGPGIYTVEVLHTGASQRLFVDGVGQAALTFSPNATTASQSAAQAASVGGKGAQPRRPTPTITPTVTPLPTTPATYTPPRQPIVVPTCTPTATPTVISTPTPAFAWQGRIVERVDGVAGTIGVRAAGLEGHLVIVSSGSWQSPPQLTGTKPELGLYATEFGGLHEGEYVVELQDLAELKVFLKGDQFLLIEFRYDFVNPPEN